MPSCVGPLCFPTPGDVLGHVASDAFDSMAHAWADSANQAVTWLVSAWTKVSTPPVSGGPASWLTDQVRPITAFVAVLGIIIAAGMISVKARQGRGDVLGRAGGGLLRLVIVGGAGAAAVNLLLLAGDTFSDSILKAAAPA